MANLAVYRALVTIPTDTALTEDYITNSWHFKGDNAGNTSLVDAGHIRDDLTVFYQAIDQDVFSSFIDSPATIKVYDLSDLPPRVPIFESTIALTAGTGNPLPTECALALSYQAPRISGIAQARRRGRIFLGPLRDPVVSVVSGRSVVTSTVLDALKAAAAQLVTDTAFHDISWAVWSPTTHEVENIPNSAFVVTNGWIDNALDTIRSRGTKATARRLWP